MAWCNPGTDLSTVPVKSNYFRFTPKSEELYNCGSYKYSANCVGGGDYGNTSASTNGGRNVSASTAGDALCSSTSKGPLCALCVAGNYLNLDANKCVPCTGYTPSSTTIIVVVMVVIIGVAAALCSSKKRRAITELGRSVSDLGRSGS